MALDTLDKIVLGGITLISLASASWLLGGEPQAVQGFRDDKEYGKRILSLKEVKEHDGYIKYSLYEKVMFHIGYPGYVVARKLHLMLEKKFPINKS